MSYNSQEFIANVQNFSISAMNLYNNSKLDYKPDYKLDSISAQNLVSTEEILQQGELMEWDSLAINKHYENNTARGNFKAITTTSKQTLPIEGAYVTISKTENGKTHVFNILRSDENGVTDTITLPTVNKEMSLNLENKKPYETYDVRVEFPGYLDTIVLNMPIFDGITSIQPFDLIPSALKRPDQKIPIVYNIEPQF